MKQIAAAKFKKQWASLIGSLSGKVTIKGDILSTGIRWDAEC